MRKHQKRTNRSPSKWKDSNRRISESDCNAIKSLTGFLDGQECFSSTYLQSEYLSKYCDNTLTPPDVRRSAAIEKWKSVDRGNRITNERLRGMDRGYNILPRVTFYAFLGFAQRLIQDILGPLSNKVIVGEFSGGASTSRRRTESSPAQKFTGQADVTGEAVAFLDLIHQEMPLLRQYGIFNSYNEVIGAELFTVPKKTDIDRCACKEPDVNMFLQKGVGKHIRRRLRRFGINLNDQSINQRLARRGSIDSSIATIDLSSASDTVTISCVEALLPRDWFLYLNDIRSQHVQVEGHLVRTEMFSSMGNGFTFELESLIFYALMRTTSYFEGISGVVSVYGDDLIIPSGLYEPASHVLREFGFSLNAEKSFHTGPFRESCGGHYFNGEDVTPFYLKRPATHFTDVIRVANQLRQWAFAEPSRSYTIPATYNVWRELASIVPEKLWGGRDYALDTQLVSPHSPGKRLVRLNHEKEEPELGSYLHWHNSKWNRTFDPVSGFEPLLTSSKCRLRNAKPGAPYLADMFHEELFASPDPH